MTRKSTNLLATLDDVFSGFRAACFSDDNLFLAENGEISVHGVWAFCSQWIRPRLRDMTPATLEALDRILNAQVGGDDGELNNAAATCFLENLAGDHGTEKLRAHLTGEAARCWDCWASPLPGASVPGTV